MLARNTPGAALLRRQRKGRRERIAESREPRRNAPDRPPEPTDRPGADAIVVRDRREAATPPQDRALYTCQCGYVFQAQVTTSVGCPHCGDAQAW